MTHSPTNGRFFPAIAVAIILFLSAFNNDHVSDQMTICKYALIDEANRAGEQMAEEIVPYLPLTNMVLRF